MREWNGLDSRHSNRSDALVMLRVTKVNTTSLFTQTLINSYNTKHETWMHCKQTNLSLN